MTAPLRFGKFTAVGAGGAALQVVLFALLAARLPAAVAACIAVELVILHNFLWHERFTWRGCGAAGVPQWFLRLFRFHLANGLISLAGNTVLAWLLVEQLHLPAMPSAALAIVICAPLNFLLADRWVFARRPPTISAPLIRL